jgi:hypothetical protein
LNTGREHEPVLFIAVQLAVRHDGELLRQQLTGAVTSADLAAVPCAEAGLQLLAYDLTVMLRWELSRATLGHVDAERDSGAAAHDK